ncbi:MAG: hypothetical protein GDA43_09270 [Hormoscilla sp. SP5CHS1]|nr:hypothetical protein [Hormoscilla sp. SP5CHS1]
MNKMLDKRLGQRPILMLFKQIKTSPLFIWGGLLTLILSVTNMAIQKLTSPGPIELAEIAASPVQSEAAEISPQTDEALPALPLWLFGAIAIGCASGSWLISQQINLIAMPANRMGAMGTRPFPGQVRRPPRLTKSRATLAGFFRGYILRFSIVTTFCLRSRE